MLLVLLTLVTTLTPAMSVNPGLPSIVTKEPSPGTVLWLDFSPENIYYNSTDGYYYIKDLSGNGNDGRIYGLTGNVLADSTIITVNTVGEHTVKFPYYNNITSASLTIYWDTSGILTPVSLSVSLNGNLLGSFVAAANTTTTILRLRVKDCTSMV